MVLLMIMMEKNDGGYVKFDYDGKRYKAVTDDMYTKGISGYIEK